MKICLFDSIAPSGADEIWPESVLGGRAAHAHVPRQIFWARVMRISHWIIYRPLFFVRHEFISCKVGHTAEQILCVPRSAADEKYTALVYNFHMYKTTTDSWL